ncbi:MAG: AMIN domain-containing protein [Nostoc sp.]
MRQGYIHSVRLTTLILRVITQFSFGMAVTSLFTLAAWAEAGTDKAENREQQPSLMNLDKDAVHNLSHANRNNLKPISIPKILQLSEIEHPNTSAQMLMGQSPGVPNIPSVPPYQGGKQGGEIVQVTGVKANPSDRGVEVILETSKGQQLQLVNRSAGNSFITDIPNAQLRLPGGNSFRFRSEKPLAGITEITVTNFDANTIRVTVTGEAAVPTVELYDSPNEGLIFSVALFP